MHNTITRAMHVMQCMHDVHKSDHNYNQITTSSTG